MLMGSTLLALVLALPQSGSLSVEPPAPHGTPRRAAVPVAWEHGVHLPVTLTEQRPELQALFDLGLAQVQLGAYLDAERSFRGVLRSDPDCAMALWGLALANPHQPARAAWYARAGWLGRGLAGPLERVLLDGLAEAWNVAGPDERPSLVEPRSPEPGEETELAVGTWPAFGPGGAKRWSDALRAASQRFTLERELLALLVDHEARSHERGWLELDDAQGTLLSEAIARAFGEEQEHPVHRRGVYPWDAQHSGRAKAQANDTESVWDVAPWPSAELPREFGELLATKRRSEAAERLARSLHRDVEYARRNWLHPSDVPGFSLRARALDDVLVALKDHSRLAGHRRQLAELPRRPPWAYPQASALSAEDVHSSEQIAVASPGWTWTPPDAVDFSLEDVNGEKHSLRDHRGHPVLVVHFLGLGCVHCVEQLQALRPWAEQFAEAGIRILAVGLQTPAELSETLRPAGEEGAYPFPLLADPRLDTFHQWRAFDDFAELPLHGTYLVDGEGRVLWIDVSHLPFMDVEGLLEECRRLLGRSR